MMKKDGKEIYTFTGLINRMDACRNRDYRFTEKDIPKAVEFRGKVYKLGPDKNFYYDQETGVTLAEIVGEAYGVDMFKYLTEHEFIVTPKEKVFLTSEEKEFLRMCGLFMERDRAYLSRIIRCQSKDTVILHLYFSSDPNSVEREEWFSIAPTTFLGLEDGRAYSLKDLKVYE
jgi:hypothetical protein